MSTPPIHLDIHGAVAELVLDRPKARNAMTRAMWRALPGLVGAAQKDQKVRVLLVHGGEAGAFCAGADIRELGALAGKQDEALRFHDEMGAALSTLASFPRPVIAAIEGPCIGAGLALALACDVRFASPTARFGVTPAKLGLAYPLADTARLVALVGPARAKDMLFSARLLDAKEALAFGLAESVMDGENFRLEARQRARHMTTLSAQTQITMKGQVNTMNAANGALATQARKDFAALFAGPDFAQGLAAFVQKRKADFSGD